MSYNDVPWFFPYIYLGLPNDFTFLDRFVWYNLNDSIDVPLNQLTGVCLVNSPCGKMLAHPCIDSNHHVTTATHRTEKQSN